MYKKIKWICLARWEQPRKILEIYIYIYRVVSVYEMQTKKEVKKIKSSWQTHEFGFISFVTFISQWKKA